jgi:hypothetical protein
VSQKVTPKGVGIGSNEPDTRTMQSKHALFIGPVKQITLLGAFMIFLVSALTGLVASPPGGNG